MKNTTEFRYSELTPAQRESAEALAKLDKRPNCIGLLFTIGHHGGVTGFRDNMPHVPHGEHNPQN